MNSEMTMIDMTSTKEFYDDTVKSYGTLFQLRLLMVNSLSLMINGFHDKQGYVVTA